MRTTALLLAATLLIAPATLAQQTIFVDATLGNDTWDGLCAAWDGQTCGPKATIQAGIDVAVDGDLVLLADGTYAGLGNRDMTFAGKAITVQGASGDPALCVIDCEELGGGFDFDNDEGPDSVLADLTIMRTGPAIGGPAVNCFYTSPTLRNCVMTQGCKQQCGIPVLLGEPNARWMRDFLQRRRGGLDWKQLSANHRWLRNPRKHVVRQSQATTAIPPLQTAPS